MTTVILDPGHGLSNRKSGVFDPGAVSNGVREADIVMDWANEIRAFLHAGGYRAIRTRINDKDPAPVGERAGIAMEYDGTIMLSIHCNAANGNASGTETFYRGDKNKAKALAINNAVVDALGTKDRGVKLESASQHKRLAVMAFQPCFLLELGFIDNPDDRAKMLDPELRAKACEALAKVLTT
jgi:N-acetylmuramoyl-L-alanine amidase